MINEGEGNDNIHKKIQLKNYFIYGKFTLGTPNGFCYNFYVDACVHISNVSG